MRSCSHSGAPDFLQPLGWHGSCLEPLTAQEKDSSLGVCGNGKLSSNSSRFISKVVSTEMVTIVHTHEVAQGSVCSDLYVALELNGADSALCERPRVLSVLASLLDRVVVRNERQALALSRSLSPQKLTVFHGLRAPTISIEKYLERIFKYANCSPSCFVVAYAYIDRFIHQQPGIPITSLNVHRLLITSVMVAAKFLDDA